MLSAALATVDADGTLPAIFLTAEISFAWLNLLSEPRLENSIEIIEVQISEAAIWGLPLDQKYFLHF